MNKSEPPIYLDYNATTPVLPEVLEAMLPYLGEYFGNPSSDHVFGRRAREAVERARFEVAELIGADPLEITFTSGGTESNNTAIFGTAERVVRRRRIVTSVIEHPATSEPCRVLGQRGWEVGELPEDTQGIVDLDQLPLVLNERTALVTVMHANNETGALQPIAELAHAAHDVGALLHTDAAQSVGKIPVRVGELGVDLLSIAGHKLYAPKGVGALYRRHGVELQPVLSGAGHEGGLRPGTENVASIVGLGAACRIANETLGELTQSLKSLCDLLWGKLSTGIPGIARNGHPTKRLPNTLNIRFPGVQGSEVLRASPGIAASTGSACHEGGETASKVLLAMGLSDDEALSSVRLSLGRGTTTSDISTAAAQILTAWQRCLAAKKG